MQVELIKRGDAKSFRVQILTPTEPLRLDGYQSCEMIIAEDEDFANIVLTLSSNNSSEAIFYDRSKGIVQYNLVSSQTQVLEPAQYPYRMKITKDSEHVYSFHDGIIEIQS